MTRLDKAKLNGMKRIEADERRACPMDYDAGPEMTRYKLVWPDDFGLKGCNGITCYKCWHEEYVE